MALLRRSSHLTLGRTSVLSSALSRSFSAIASSPPPLPRSSPTFPPRLPFGSPIDFHRPHILIKSLSFRSAAPLSNRRYDDGGMKDDKFGPDDILFEGCDYNHWLITMDFPKDPAPTREEMIETYIQTLAKVVGSVEEAKKKMYALSTTTYNGFQAVMTEEMSEKFKGLPGVVFVLPDSYIDPVNKEYGGDKYEEGVITPRPPPIQYRPTRARNQNRYDRPNYNRPPPQGNLPPNQQGSMQGDGRNYAPQQNYSQPGQDGRVYGVPGGGESGPAGERRGFGQGGQGNYGQPSSYHSQGDPSVERRGFVQGEQINYGRDFSQGDPTGERRGFGQGEQRNYGKDFSQGDRGIFVPQDQRNFSPGPGGDGRFPGPPGYVSSGPSRNGGYNQQPMPNNCGGYRQGENSGYTGDNSQGGSGYNQQPVPNNGGGYRQGENSGYTGDNSQGGSGYGHNYRQN